jgi:hypothetical protein
MNQNIANIIKYLHILIIVYIFIGWLVTPINYLHYYIFMIIIIFLDWNDFDSQCILTRLEYYFRTGIWNPKESPEFFRPMINKLFNLNLNKDQGNRLNSFSFMFCLLLGFYRFQKTMRKNLVHNKII